MFERFTLNGRRVIAYAQREAVGLGDDFLGPGHILLGLLYEDGVVARALESHGIALEATRAALGHGKPEVDPPRTGQIPFTAAAKQTLDVGVREATALGSDVAPEHLLLGLVQSADGATAVMLGAAGLDRDTVLSAFPDESP